MGIKPLYYAKAGDNLYFASEIKALLACSEISVELDPVSLYQYLAYLYVPNPRSLFKGILKLPPGHVLSWKAGRVLMNSYWDLKTGAYFDEPEGETVERLRSLLFKTVRRQLISDVPIGFFLSGGLDSSTLVACAAQTHDSALDCYTIAYEQQYEGSEQCITDAHYAKLVASHFGASFHEISVNPDVVGLLPKVAWHLDSPIADPAAIATLLISQAAATNVTVLLSGQGADEVLGGYRVHRVHKTNGLLRLIPQEIRESVGPAALNWLGKHNRQILCISPGLVLAFCRFSEKMLRTSGMEPWEQYASLRSYLGDDDLQRLLSSEIAASTIGSSHRDVFRTHFEKVSGEDFLNQMLYVDAKTFLPDLNLEYSDKLSMASSIEVRVPFLDNEVVDFLLQVPPRLKIKGMTQKYILRKAMQGILPQSILQRRKAAFGLPVRSWLKGPLHEMLCDLLSPERVRRRNILEPDAVTRMIRANDAGERDYSLPLWSLLTLELWHQAFVDQKSAVALEQTAV
jgi:asparagine synthase (glutamine-hydrolysing)